MKKIMLNTCILDFENLKNVICISVFGSYHEKFFSKDRSDIDIAILLSNELDWCKEFEIEDYLQSILPKHFSHNNIHYTFLTNFNYPFSELLLTSNDKIILKEEAYLDYSLGYSAFKRDRENLEIIRNENLKDLKEYRSGLL